MQWCFAYAVNGCSPDAAIATLPFGWYNAMLSSTVLTLLLLPCSCCAQQNPNGNISKCLICYKISVMNNHFAAFQFSFRLLFAFCFLLYILNQI